jgi:hypothetical protein
MGRPGRIPAKESVIAAASLCVAAALPGCSAAPSSAAPSAADPPAATTVHSTARPARAAFAFTVAGDRPVRPSGSQDTHAQTPNATCDSATFASDKALGARLARAFALAGFPLSADLLAHFLAGQGLTVTGRGTRENGRYAGTLSYVIRDSYGFPVGDTLDGFGPPMRYLQTVCGVPRHAGGAHWFPDTITVTVPFNRLA